MGADSRRLPAGPLPRHVAVIMDGNGRWAAERGLSRLEGHRQGVDRVRELVTYAREIGIAYLTLYAFSHQNWCRPPAEVAGLMGFLSEFCVSERDSLLKNGVRVCIIGDLGNIPAATRAAVDRLVAETAANDSMVVCMALDYGGREELVRAARDLANDVQAARLRVDDIDEAQVNARLYTAPMPDPDLLIRTSGEQRLSNFLLWQAAYSELYFCPHPWPDFTCGHFLAALDNFAGRQRRFGATGEQLAGSAAADAAPGALFAAGPRLALAKGSEPG